VDAAYFVAWVDRLIAAARGNASWNTEAEKQAVVGLLEVAKKRYEALAQVKGLAVP
jgi:hypothetical protein